MCNTRYERVVVIGYGWITGEVVKNIYEHRNSYGYSLEYIEHEVHEFGTVKSFCKENNILSSTIEDKEELTSYLSDICELTLIISASSNYLIPKKVLNKDNIVAINFHNALLPMYPGRNAPSWVIYENEKETGITWHYVTDAVDAGNIIIQKKISINNDIKAYELANELMILAYEAFKECIDDVLTDKVESIEQTVAHNRKMYLSKDIPGGGCFSENDSWEYIYRLLRSVDYAKYNIFPPVTGILNGQKVQIVRYKIVDKQNAKNGEGFWLIPADDDKYLQIKYRIINN